MGNKIREDLIKPYDRQASGREAGGIQDWKREERDSYLSLLKKEGKLTLLEIGSGPGRDGKYFQENGLKVTCIDLSPENIRLCRQKGLSAHVMNMNDLSFPVNSFDSVYSMNSLLHLKKAELPSVLRAIDSVLTPAGLFFLGVYGGKEFEGMRENDDTEPGRFFSFFTNDHIKEVASEVFDILYFRKIPIPEIVDTHFQSVILRKKTGH